MNQERTFTRPQTSDDNYMLNNDWGFDLIVYLIVLILSVMIIRTFFTVPDFSIVNGTVSTYSKDKEFRIEINYKLKALSDDFSSLDLGKDEKIVNDFFKSYLLSFQDAKMFKDYPKSNEIINNYLNNNLQFTEIYNININVKKTGFVFKGLNEDFYLTNYSFGF